MRSEISVGVESLSDISAASATAAIHYPSRHPREQGTKVKAAVDNFGGPTVLQSRIHQGMLLRTCDHRCPTETKS